MRRQGAQDRNASIAHLALPLGSAPTPGSIRKGKCTGPRASACSCIPPSTYTCWLPSSSPSWVQTLTNLGMRKMGTWKPSRIKVHVEYDMRRIKFRIIICRSYNANLDAEIELLKIPSSNARLAARIPLTKISSYLYFSDSLEMNSVKTLVAKRTNLCFFGSFEWRGWCEASLEPPRKPHHFDNQNLEMESKMSSSMRFNFYPSPCPVGAFSGNSGVGASSRVHTDPKLSTSCILRQDIAYNWRKTLVRPLDH